MLLKAEAEKTTAIDRVRSSKSTFDCLRHQEFFGILLLLRQLLSLLLCHVFVGVAVAFLVAVAVALLVAVAIAVAVAKPLH